MKEPFEDAKRRTFQYWFSDGLLEVIFGGLCLLLGLYLWLQAVVPPGTPLAALFSIGLVLVVIGGSFAVRRAAQALKERLTYPRTGYIAYRRSQGRQLWMAVLAVIGVIALVALLATEVIPLAWMPAITGLIFGAIWLAIAYRSRLLRFYLLAAISLVSGIGLTLAGIGDTLGLAVFYALIGAALLVSGGCTLRLYLKGEVTVPDAQTSGVEEDRS